jgi:hypothetical protein
VPVAGDSKFFSREEDPGTHNSGARASAGAQQNSTSTPEQDHSSLGRGPPRGNSSPARQVGAAQIAPCVTTPSASLFATCAVWERFAGDSVDDLATSCDIRAFRVRGPHYGGSSAARASLRDKSAAPVLGQPSNFEGDSPQRISPPAHRRGENANHAVHSSPSSTLSRSARVVLQLKQRPSKQDDFSDDDDDFAATFKNKARSVRLLRPEQHFRHSDLVEFCRVRPQCACRVPAAPRLQQVWIEKADIFQAPIAVPLAIGQRFRKRAQEQGAQYSQGNTAARPTAEEVRREEICRQRVESEQRGCDTSPLCLAWCITTATAPQLQRTQIERASAIQASKTTSPATRSATLRPCTGLECPGVFVTAASQQERGSRQDFAAAVPSRLCTCASGKREKYLMVLNNA